MMYELHLYYTIKSLFPPQSYFKKFTKLDGVFCLIDYRNLSHISKGWHFKSHLLLN